MRTSRSVASLVALLSIAAVAACDMSKDPPSLHGQPKKSTPIVADVTDAGSSSAATKPTEDGVDEAALDRSTNACDDFYQFACGGWMKATPIPEDRSSWARGFSIVDERNEAKLHEILERAAKGSDPELQKLGDFWSACMDEDAIEKADLAPLKDLFAAIDGMKSAKDLPAVILGLQKQGIDALFDFSSGQDFGDATQVIGQLDQGGLGLPDRDYYLSDEGKNGEIRKLYEEHVGKMLALAGFDAAGTKAVMAIETSLAKGSMDKVDRRDPKKVYHRMERADVKKLAPDFDWDGFFDGLSVASSAPINVATPAFFKSFDPSLAKTSLEDWKTYLRWHVVASLAPTLPKRFVDEDFAFTSSALTGAKSQRPRWKRCIDAADGALGELLAQPFVKEMFGADGKSSAQGLVGSIEAAMRQDLGTLSWMDDDTRKKAGEKLSKINNKIGFPDVWRDYSSLAVDRTSYATNVLNANAFEVARVLAKIGKPLDRKEWLMTPPTVNAYYDQSMNEMVFPAGILQPPFYDKKAVLAVNYGAIGMVMGHELTHAFDDQGRQFDGDGNLKDWWTPTVSAEFDKRSGCVADQYSSYVPIDDLHINGKLTLGENIADNGGLKLAHAAYEVAKTAEIGKPKGSSKWTDEQRFYLGFAQAWCQNTRPQRVRLLVNVDPHSPAKFRVNGPIANDSAFAEAFSCKAGSAMVRPPADRCEVW